MVSWVGLACAFTWGTSAGIITSIPLGPTGALVLRSASCNSRSGIFCAVAGLTCAQIVFQMIYHFGLSHYFIAHHHAVSMLGIAGILLTGFLGLTHLLRARRYYFSFVSKAVIEGNPHIQAENVSSPQIAFFKSLASGLCNPFILVYIFTNVSMFATSFPDFNHRSYIAVLLIGGIIGTALWYLFFGEIVRTRAGSMGIKGQFLSELASGALMLIAGFYLFFRLL